MKKLFYSAIIALILFEIANVYFIMPMPGSQRMDSVGLAYFLYSWRWWFRIGLGLLAAIGLYGSKFSKRGHALLAIGVIGFWAIVTYKFNFEMTADKMFIQPELIMKPIAENKVDTGRVVLGIVINGAPKAYPIQFMAYHHQVRDTLGGQPIMVTYCNVCRTGRVYQPKIAGKNEVFRLVGMDHFNAMFEDATTHSWWRQENGEAIAGPLIGQLLPEITCDQMSLSQWFKLYPSSLVMQPDTTYKTEYDQQKEFETGKKKSKLTGTDSISWTEKSWVIGVQVNGVSKAFDWNELKARRLLHEQVGTIPILIALATDNKGFTAFERAANAVYTLEQDTLINGAMRYDFAGHAAQEGVPDLKKVSAYQEFWHSWQTFHQ